MGVSDALIPRPIRPFEAFRAPNASVPGALRLARRSHARDTHWWGAAGALVTRRGRRNASKGRIGRAHSASDTPFRGVPRAHRACQARCARSADRMRLTRIRSAGQASIAGAKFRRLRTARYRSTLQPQAPNAQRFAFGA